MSEEPGKYQIETQPKKNRIYKSEVDITEQIDSRRSQLNVIAQAKAKLRNGLRARAIKAIDTSTFDPTLMDMLHKLGDIYIESCDISFTEFVIVMVEEIGDEIRPFLKRTYEVIRQSPEIDFADEMTPEEEVASIDVDAIQVF